MKTYQTKAMIMKLRCMDRKKNIYNLEEVHTFVSPRDLINIYREFEKEIFATLKGLSPSEDLPASIQEKLDRIDQQVLKYFRVTEYYFADERVRQRPDKSFEIFVDGEYIIVKEIPPTEFWNELMGRYSPFDD